MVRRASFGLLFLVVFLVTRGVAHSVPIGRFELAAEKLGVSADLMLADLNGDQIITGSDFARFRACYIDQGGPGCEIADFDGNQVIDLIDFEFFAAAYSAPTQLVTPEPGTLLLVATGCLLLATRNRRRGR